MKTVVVTGGGRHVGKTTLVRALGVLLPEAKVVKLGTHTPREDKPERFFPRGTRYTDVRRSIGGCAYLILESGAILDDSDLQPDLVIFLPAPSGRTDKPGSERRRARADLVRGQPLAPDRAAELAERLGVSAELFAQLLAAVESPPQN